MKKTAKITVMSPVILLLLYMCLGQVHSGEIVQLQRQADGCECLDEVRVVVAGHHFPEVEGCYEIRPKHSRSLQRRRTYTKEGSPITLSSFGSQVRRSRCTLLAILDYTSRMIGHCDTVAHGV